MFLFANKIENDIFCIDLLYGVVRAFRIEAQIGNQVYWSILLIAWVNSISVGANAYYFSIGILLMNITSFSCYDLTQYLNIKNLKIPLITIALTSLFFASSIYLNKREHNYRDLPQDELTYDMAKFPEFGSIKTNKMTQKYFEELHLILNGFDDFKNQFTIIPNAAIVYRLINSRNPMPIDWIQPAEFSGLKERINKKIQDLIDHKKLILFLKRSIQKTCICLNILKIIPNICIPN